MSSAYKSMGSDPENRFSYESQKRFRESTHLIPSRGEFTRRSKRFVRRIFCDLLAVLMFSLPDTFFAFLADHNCGTSRHAGSWRGARSSDCHIQTERR
jgi:hypothetical protein